MVRLLRQAVVGSLASAYVQRAPAARGHRRPSERRPGPPGGCAAADPGLPRQSGLTLRVWLNASQTDALPP